MTSGVFGLGVAGPYSQQSWVAVLGDWKSDISRIRRDVYSIISSPQVCNRAMYGGASSRWNEFNVQDVVALSSAGEEMVSSWIWFGALSGQLL
jgi:hypothetical protein